jgi:hypothetical protein
MPGSVVEGKDMTREFCIKNDVHTVLDVGPGEATYYFALQGADITKLDGVEIFPRYISDYDLGTKYNDIFVGDIYNFDWEAHERYDLVILGDIIEHMIEERGRKVIADAVKYAKFVVVSLPIYGWEQGEACGNIYEAHVEQYTHDRMLDVLKDYEMLDFLVGAQVGVYFFKERES